jgi:hypothetical protein
VATCADLFILQVHASKGATIMRAFANSHFNSVPDPIMPSFGQYNESAFQRLDLALVAAAQHGIRLILVLGNYWPFLGGTFLYCIVISLKGRAQWNPYLLIP